MAHVQDNPAERTLGRAAVVAGVIVLALFCSTYFLHPFNISHEADWLQYPARYRFARACWLAGAPPLWCPYFGGGYFIAGDPDGQTLTLITPFVLAFGEIVGLKAALAAAHFVAAAGMYYLMRRVWGLPSFASAYAALLLALSTWLPGRIFQGNWPEMYYAATPWLAAFCLRAKRRPAFVLALGAALGLILPQARQGWAALVLFVALFSALDAVRRDGFRLRVLWIVGAACVVALLVGAVKLLPAAWLLRDGLPLQAGRDLYSPASIVAVHWSRLLSWLVRPDVDVVRHQSSELCIGYVGVALALVGFAAAWRKTWRLAVLLSLLTWLVMAWRAPADLFHYLHSLPVFGTMSNPVRDLGYFVVFALAAAAGFGVAACWRGPRMRWIMVVVCAASVAEATRSSLAYRRFQFPHSPPSAQRASEFHQVYCLVEPRWAQRPARGNAYFNMRRGVGTVNYHTSLALVERAEPKWFIDRFGRRHANSLYRGEAYALGGAAAATVNVDRPNRIRVCVTLPQPDTVVINQNFDASWRASSGQVVEREGLLALRLGAGEHDVELRYGSWLFVAGAMVSLAALALCAWLAWSRVGPVRRVRIALRRLFTTQCLPWWAASVVGGVAALGLCALLHGKVESDRLVARAVAHMAFERYDAAASLLWDAVKLRPGGAEIWRRLGTCWMRTGRVSQGLDALRKARAIAPRDSLTGIELARALGAAGRPQAALEVLAQVEQRFPHRADAHMWEAVCRCALGQLDDAERALRRSIELGFADEAMLKTFPPLEPLRERQGFERLLRELRARQDGGMTG